MIRLLWMFNCKIIQNIIYNVFFNFFVLWFKIVYRIKTKTLIFLINKFISFVREKLKRWENIVSFNKGWNRSVRNNGKFFNIRKSTEFIIKVSNILKISVVSCSFFKSMLENKFIIISSSIFPTNKSDNLIRYSWKQPATLWYIELKYSMQIWRFSDNWLMILISFGFEKDLISTWLVKTSRSVLIRYA